MKRFQYLISEKYVNYRIVRAIKTIVSYQQIVIWPLRCNWSLRVGGSWCCNVCLRDSLLQFLKLQSSKITNYRELDNLSGLFQNLHSLLVCIACQLYIIDLKNWEVEKILWKNYLNKKWHVFSCVNRIIFITYQNDSIRNFLMWINVSWLKKYILHDIQHFTFLSDPTFSKVNKSLFRHLFRSFSQQCKPFYSSTQIHDELCILSYLFKMKSCNWLKDHWL